MELAAELRESRPGVNITIHLHNDKILPFVSRMHTDLCSGVVSDS